MKTLLFRNNNDKKLTLFFTGWGFDCNPFTDILSRSGNNVLMCYDYSDLYFDFDTLKEWEDIKIIAWSMGVWASSVLMEQHAKLRFPAIAINGTTSPIDIRTGIPPQVFHKTLNELSEETLLKFFRNICLNEETYLQLLDNRPRRDIEDLRNELSSIEKLSHQFLGNPNYFHKAIIGKRDRIFPYANQKSAWKNCPDIHIVDDAHFLSVENWQSILSGTNPTAEALST